jgi:hypothetical protein
MSVYFYAVRAEVLNGDRTEFYFTDRSEEPTPLLNIAREQFKNIVNTLTQIVHVNESRVNFKVGTFPAVAVVLEVYAFYPTGMTIATLDRIDVLQEVNR